MAYNSSYIIKASIPLSGQLLHFSALLIIQVKTSPKHNSEQDFKPLGDYKYYN
jgi:hypothetical protein